MLNRESKRYQDRNEIVALHRQLRTMGPDLQNLAATHPIFQEKGLPDNKRINKAALAQAGEDQLGPLLRGHIATRMGDIVEARARVKGKNELIYKMDEEMMSQFYAQQGIEPGSIYDMIIQDKLYDDAIIELVIGIGLALAAIALTVVSLGSATPAIVAAGAAVGAFGLSAYTVYDEYQKYAEQNDLADVSLAEDPSIVWLVVAIAGAALDLGAAVRALDALAKTAKALKEGGDVVAFMKQVKALQEAGEIDAKIAGAVQKAALARQSFAEASAELTRSLAGKFYTFPAGPFTDPAVFPILLRMAKAKLEEGISSFRVFALELKKARALTWLGGTTPENLARLEAMTPEELAKLGAMTPDELTKAKEAWGQALSAGSAAKGDVESVVSPSMQDAVSSSARRKISEQGNVSQAQRKLQRRLSDPERSASDPFAGIKPKDADELVQDIVANADFQVSGAITIGGSGVKGISTNVLGSHGYIIFRGQQGVLVTESGDFITFIDKSRPWPLIQD